MKTTAVKFCALLAVAVSTTAFATVTINSGDRSVKLNNSPTPTISQGSLATSGNYLDSIVDSGGSDNTATSGQVGQDTSLQPTSMGGTGSAHVTGHTGSPNSLAGRSHMIVTLTTDISYDWVINGTLGVNLDGGSGLAYVSFTDNNAFSEVFYKDTVGSFGSTAVSGSGTIPAGFYTFEIYAQANGTNGGNSFATASFDSLFLELTPSAVPEPASLSLLAIGGAALMMRRRK